MSTSFLQLPPTHHDRLALPQGGAAVGGHWFAGLLSGGELVPSHGRDRWLGARLDFLPMVAVSPVPSWAGRPSEGGRCLARDGRRAPSDGRHGPTNPSATKGGDPHVPAFPACTRCPCGNARGLRTGANGPANAMHPGRGGLWGKRAIRRASDTQSIVAPSSPRRYEHTPGDMSSDMSEETPQMNGHHDETTGRFVSHPTVERFWSKVDRSGECWIWTAGKASFGYGSFWDGSRHVRSHRFAFERENGPIAEGLCVLHRCDQPACVRPDHLFLGTRDDNMADMVNKGRQASGERTGACLYPERRALGERLPQARLTDDLVRSIRDRYRTGTVLQRQLAEEFGVNQSTISLVVRGSTWGHVR